MMPMVLVAGPAGKRKVPLRDWFLGPRKTVLKRGEIATGVAVPLPEEEAWRRASSNCGGTKEKTLPRPA